MIKTAKETDMIVAGHIQESLGLDGIVAHGQKEVVHLKELLNEFLIGYEKGQYSMPFDMEIDESRIESVVKKLKDSGTTLCVTMVIDATILRKVADPIKFLQEPLIDKYLDRK